MAVLPSHGVSVRRNGGGIAPLALAIWRPDGCDEGASACRGLAVRCPRTRPLRGMIAAVAPRPWSPDRTLRRDRERRSPRCRACSAARWARSATSTWCPSGSARPCRSVNQSGRSADPPTSVPRRLSRSCSTRCASAAMRMDGEPGKGRVPGPRAVAPGGRAGHVTRAGSRSAGDPGHVGGEDLAAACPQQVPRPGRRLDTGEHLHGRTGTTTRACRPAPERG